MRTRNTIAAFAACALLIAACGSDDDSGGGDTTPAATDAPDATDGGDEEPATTDGGDEEPATTEGSDEEPADDGALASIAAPDCDYGGSLSSIEALDELTVQFTLCNPDVAFESKVAFSAFGIHPSEVLEATGGGGPELFENPVGTGPYQLVEWDRGNQLVLGANENYWGDARRGRDARVPLERGGRTAPRRAAGRHRRRHRQPGSRRLRGHRRRRRTSSCSSARAPTSSTSASTATCRRSTTNSCARPLVRRSTVSGSSMRSTRRVRSWPISSCPARSSDTPTSPSWYELRRRGGQGAPRRGRFPRRLRCHAQLPRRGAQLPAVAGHGRRRHPGPARRHRHQREHRGHGVRCIPRRQRRR